MKTIFKKSLRFTVITTLCLVVTMFFVAVSCDKQETPRYIDPTLLVGEWDCIKFAYTADGKTILDINTLSKGRIIISNLKDKWAFVHTNEIFYNHSLSGNLIQLTMNGSTFVMPPQEEINICEALENAYSFAIKDNELMIYFTGDDNKNLLILKNNK
ncbi:hypothetical protein AGMMS50239_34360 [Bacteroidia bacterium]|nr:hypothetical protein AGMMS50239_34360 [Bacteroidia bacterium]